jgi:outer membrane immunogenic protein
MTRKQAMKPILATVLFSAVATGAALASDLPPPAAPPPRAPAVYAPPPPVYNWTGFYIGINGGWAFGKSDWTVPNASTGNFNVNGGLVGGTVGFNWWADGWVVGLEGDFDGQWLDGKVSSTCLPANCETKSTWLSTIRGRFGYAADRVLFYLTAGGAFGNIEANTATTFQSESKGGWTAGAGLEGTFTDHWTARLEYLFVDLQNASGFTTLPGPTTVKLNENLIRLGVDYKF